MRITIIAATLIALSSAAFAAATPPVAPPTAPVARPPAPTRAAVPQPIDPQAAAITASRQELGAAWDDAHPSDQRKKNAVIGVLNADNAVITSMQSRNAELNAQHVKDEAEIARLNNALAAEKRAEALKPNPALKAHQNSLVGDKGQPLIFESRPPQGVPAKGKGATKP